ncbi:MAG: RraA family protein [Alphaproteobacteria bacterium]|nr:RraA family protein [Alphaproteobacteria bacterium]MCZ6609460.1 RraA family protein [Alphaproteobacteria bacterium]MCZ6814062.1 RraA family protein [Alphaproteobacteria bacterium]
MDELVERLSKLDACTVSDALDRLGLRGATLGILPMWPCPRISGRAVTVKLKPQGGVPPKRHLGTEAIEAAQAGDVLVMELSGRTDVPGWGGLLSLAAQVKGLAGIVIDGACRDIDDSAEAGFPVFAKAVVPITARGRVVQDSVNQEIAFAGTQVHPGDLVVADGSGVIIVSQASAEEVIDAGEEIAAREAAMTKAVRDGMSIVEVLEKGGYQSMLDKGKAGDG